VTVEDAEDVGDGLTCIESTMTDWVDATWDWKVVVIVGVAVVFEEDVDDVRGALVATTVRAVLVGITASRCPRQTLYAAPAALSAIEQPVYTQPRATSPSDSPLLL
jgi:hypothetical protein